MVTIKKIYKTQEKFNDICNYLEQNITKENLSINGGTLNYKNLTYDSDVLFVAYDNDNEKLVGYNSVIKYEDGYYIYQIAVKKEFQNQGIGKQLALKSIELAESEKELLTAHIMEYNEASKRLFSSLGFKKLSVNNGNGFYVLDTLNKDKPFIK